MTTIDVIIPTRNRPMLTQRALRSVLDQSHTDVTVHVVDDGSDAGSYAELREAIAALPRVNLIRNEMSLGPALARQVGFDAGVAEWVATLDSDDEWLPTKLTQQLALADATHADLVLCWFAWVREDGSTRVVRKPDGRGRVSPSLTNNIDIPLARRALVQGCGAFRGDDASPHHCDEHVDFMMRLLSQAEVAVVPEVLVHCHDHAGDRASDDIGANVESYQRLIDARAPLFADFPDDLATLHARLGARMLAAGQRREGLRQMRGAFTTATWPRRAHLVREFGPFTIKRMVTPR
ncbi:MAG: glycosyltransferase family 2 protein [Actinomycetota bacterium]